MGQSTELDLSLPNATPGCVQNFRPAEPGLKRPVMARARAKLKQTRDTALFFGRNSSRYGRKATHVM